MNTLYLFAPGTLVNDSDSLRKKCDGLLPEVNSCSVEEEIDGKYEMAMELNAKASNAGRIKLGSLVRAKITTIYKQPYLNEQFFKVYKISRDISGKVKCNLQHISYELSEIYIDKPFQATSLLDLINKLNDILKTECEKYNRSVFSIKMNVDPDIKKEVYIDSIKSIKNVLGVIIEEFDVEIEFDNTTVIINKNRGNHFDNKIPYFKLSYGKDIKSFTHDLEDKEGYTHIQAYWMDSSAGAYVKANELYPLLENYKGSKKIYLYDATSDINEKFEQDFLSNISENTEPAKAKNQQFLQEFSKDYFSKHPDMTKNKASIKMKFLNLAKSLTDAADLDELYSISLGDSIEMDFYDMYSDMDSLDELKSGINKTNPELTRYTGRFISYKYDVLKEKYEDCNIGDIKEKFVGSSVVESTNNSSHVTETEANKNQFIDEMINVFGGANGGYVKILRNSKGQPQEIWVMSSDNEKSVPPPSVLVINKNGIGFSQNGVPSIDNPPNSAWDINGAFRADYISTGTLNASLLKTGTILIQNPDTGETVLYANVDTGEVRLSPSVLTISPTAKEIDIRNNYSTISKQSVIPNGDPDIQTDNIIRISHALTGKVPGIKIAFRYVENLISRPSPDANPPTDTDEIIVEWSQNNANSLCIKRFRPFAGDVLTQINEDVWIETINFNNLLNFSRKVLNTSWIDKQTFDNNPAINYTIAEYFKTLTIDDCNNNQKLQNVPIYQESVYANSIDDLTDIKHINILYKVNSEELSLTKINPKCLYYIKNDELSEYKYSVFVTLTENDYVNELRDENVKDIQICIIKNDGTEIRYGETDNFAKTADTNKYFTDLYVNEQIKNNITDKKVVFTESGITKLVSADFKIYKQNSALPKNSKSVAVTDSGYFALSNISMADLNEYITNNLKYVADLNIENFNFEPEEFNIFKTVIRYAYKIELDDIVDNDLVTSEGYNEYGFYMNVANTRYDIIGLLEMAYSENALYNTVNNINESIEKNQNDILNLSDELETFKSSGIMQYITVDTEGLHIRGKILDNDQKSEDTPFETLFQSNNWKIMKYDSTGATECIKIDSEKVSAGVLNASVRIDANGYLIIPMGQEIESSQYSEITNSELNKYIDLFKNATNIANKEKYDEIIKILDDPAISSADKLKYFGVVTQNSSYHLVIKHQEQ